MRPRDARPRLRNRVTARLRRAYRYSELRKLQLWLKGRTLHWALFLVAACLMIGGLLGLHNYLYSFFYVVSVGDREVGVVRDAAEIEDFVARLTDQCSLLYGMAVQPREAISLILAHRPQDDADTLAVKEALRREITLVTDAVMVMVDDVPVLAVACANDLPLIVELLCNNYVSEKDNVELLQVSIVEEIAGMPCSVPPEHVFTAVEVAELLLAAEPLPERVLLSRGNYSREPVAGALSEEPETETEDSEEQYFPAIHVVVEEEVTVQERIPFSTTYTYTSSLWSVQSRIVTSGRDGSKTVVYHITSENGIEKNRQKVSEQVLEPPVTQVIERGTARVPSMGTGQFVWPVEGGGRLTQGFRGWSHSGIDISYASQANRYARILAADSGVVVETGSRWPMGNYIIIYHGRYYTLYLHNSAHFVSKGQTVSRGQHIANMGNTGRTYGGDGIHLHFEVRISDGSGVWQHWRQHQPVDPLNFFPLR